MFDERLRRVRDRMEELGVDCLLLSVGADLPWLTGYEAMPLERLTMLVVPRESAATLVVPRLEEPRVEAHPDVFTVRAWGETEDPLELVARSAGRPPRSAAIGDRTWARFVLGLQERWPDTTLRPASGVLGPLRAVKDPAELAALRDAAAAVDTVAVAMRDRPFGGRTELHVGHELSARMLDAGHSRVDFVIVASGPNGASPHHEPSERVVGEGDLVVCDFGGLLAGYSSDVTRMYSVGEPAAEITDAYAALARAQTAAVQAARAGVPAEDVDRAARSVLDDAGFGDRFVHRTGHGIGVETHEEPWIVRGNTAPLAVGNVFSVEPGIYTAGRWGMRLEDIVAVGDAGPERLNHAPRDIAMVG